MILNYISGMNISRRRIDLQSRAMNKNLPLCMTGRGHFGKTDNMAELTSSISGKKGAHCFLRCSWGQPFHLWHRQQQTLRRIKTVTR
jgi:iron complex outermembrane receptor protein